MGGPAGRDLFRARFRAVRGRRPLSPPRGAGPRGGGDRGVFRAGVALTQPSPKGRGLILLPLPPGEGRGEGTGPGRGARGLPLGLAPRVARVAGGFLFGEEGALAGGFLGFGGGFGGQAGGFFRFL